MRKSQNSLGSRVNKKRQARIELVGAVGRTTGIGLCGMYFDRSLDGRQERRLTIMVDVYLAPLEHLSAEGREKTFTDNLSALGLRVHSKRPWHPGEHAEIIPVKGETPMRGEVVYCQKVDNEGFFVGFKFPHSRLPWSILHRFNSI